MPRPGRSTTLVGSGQGRCDRTDVGSGSERRDVGGGEAGDQGEQRRAARSQ